MKIFSRLSVFVLAVCLMLFMLLPAAGACAEHVYDVGSIVLEPTCDTIGIVVYTCSVCGFQVEEKLGNLGHDMENGACIRCGLQEDGSYAAPAKSEEADVAEVTLQHKTAVETPTAAEKLPAITTPAETRQAGNGGRIFMMLFGAAMILLLPFALGNGRKKSAARRRKSH